jgi:anti-sigma regulatory factor (Ser/Thr protein kinase)
LSSTANLHHLEHPALLYRGLEDFLEVMVPDVRAGIDNDETVFVAARGDYLPAPRAELNDRAEAAQLADTFEWHPHPASRLRAFHEFVWDELESGAGQIRLAGEPVWQPEPPEFIREWQRYESALNAVLAPFPVSLMCLYDSARLQPSIIDGALRTHPTIHRSGTQGASDDFEDPEEFLRRQNPSPPTPPAHAASLPNVADAQRSRRFLSETALRAGVPADRAADLNVAANEVLTNALVHGGGASMWAWTEGGRFVCHIEDRGRGITDPLAGYKPPSEHVANGRGLWIARQLVDLLQIVPGTTGTVVRLWIAKA